MMKGKQFAGRMLAALLCIVLIATMLPVFASAASLNPPKMKKLSNVEKGVKIQWNASSGASGYRVFRKTSEKGSWKAIADVTGTTYTDTKANSGKTYYYAVRALDGAGNVASKFSKNPKSIVYYKAPLMKGAAVLSNGIKVTWKASKGAKLYRIYRSTDGGAWKKIGTSKTNEYLDKNVKYGKEYEYYVRVVDEKNKKTLSSYDKTPVKAVFTKKAEITSLANKNGYVQVKWAKVKGISKYRLFRKIADGDWFTVTTTTDTSYNDTDVENNLTYTYYVRGMDASGNSVGLYADGKSITYYVSPETKSCVRSGSNLVTTWDPVEGISSYVVFRRISGGEWIKIGTSDTTSYTDSSMPSGTYCEYTVACADGTGAIVSAYGVHVVGAESYKDIPVLNTITNGDGFVTITWSTVDKAAKYKVFRKIGDNTAKFTAIATVEGTSYKDTSVTNCKKYTYTVCACNSSGDEESMYNTTGLSITYYTPPTISSLTNVVSGVQIKWGKIDGVANYKIWRKTGNTGWTVIATVHGANSSYTYTDTDVVNNGHYNYTISCSADSESAYKTPGKDKTFYSAPTITTVTTNDGSITISWSAVESISSYKIQRKIGSGSWKDLATQSTRTYTDTDVTSGKKYTYRVCSASGSTAVSGYYTSAARIYLAPPTLKSVSSKEKGKVTLTWEVSVVGANTYDIYAMAYPGGTWTKIASAAPVDKSCTVNGLTSGQNYAFKLVAVNGNSRSADSNTKKQVVK